jgi:hypothetical protein
MEVLYYPVLSGSYMFSASILTPVILDVATVEDLQCRVSVVYVLILQGFYVNYFAIFYVCRFIGQFWTRHQMFW